jgi:hypothetical protein
MTSDEHAAELMVYSEECRRRFEAPSHAGPPPEGAAIARGEARGRDGHTRVVLWLGERPRGAWFLAYGCPWTLAAADLAAEIWGEGRDDCPARELADRLGAPADRMDVFLTVEDAWRAARAEMIK